MTPAEPEEDVTIADEESFDDEIEERRNDADEFFNKLASGPISDDLRNVMRQALAGMMWCVPFLGLPSLLWFLEGLDRFFNTSLRIRFSSSGRSSSTSSSRRSGSRETLDSLLPLPRGSSSETRFVLLLSLFSISFRLEVRLIRLMFPSSTGMEAHAYRRHPLDARQVGVPFLR
jgi:hypothetical protein